MREATASLNHLIKGERKVDGESKAGDCRFIV